MSAVYTRGETQRNIMLSSAAVCGVWEVYYLVPHVNVSSLYSGGDTEEYYVRSVGGGSSRGLARKCGT